MTLRVTIRYEDSGMKTICFVCGREYIPRRGRMTSVVCCPPVEIATGPQASEGDDA